MNLILIAIGGAIGSVARFLSTQVINKFLKISNSDPQKFLQKFSFFTASFPSFFPCGTFLVNVIGSLLAGILYFFIIRNFENFDENLKNFLLVGFLGGFTTFSAFSLDFFRLFTAGQHAQAMIYAVSSVLFSILALFFGFYLTKIIFS